MNIGHPTPEEAARMFLWFKEQLPPHDVSQWYITAVPAPPPEVLEDSDTSLTHTHMRSLRGPDAKRVEGYGRCARCGQRFELQNSGDAIALDDKWVGRVVEKLKGRARGAAERSGPCWGNVPSC